METITYLNLKVEGAPIKTITQLQMENRMNTYGRAFVAGEVDYGEGSDYVKKAQPGTMVTICTSAEGQPQKLFVGVVANAGIRKQGEYAQLELTLCASASQLDKQRKNQSFQNMGSTYEQIINKSLAGAASVRMKASDHATGKLIMQYNETGWAFTQRMASALGAPISANTDTAIPVITVGIPKTGKSYTLSGVEQGLPGGKADIESMGQSFGATQLVSTQAVLLGDQIQYGDSQGIVQGYRSNMQDGTLKTTIEVSSGTAGSAGGGAGGMAGSGAGGANPMQPQQITNTQASGKMFTGIVQGVKLDKVQVHLIDIDESYDGGGDFWFPYSTAYSSSDGSGFYCMPKENDTVRVFFPSDNEADAFAASSVNVSPLDNPKDKKWRSPAGKEILMTEEGLFITCKDEKIFINLQNEDGITICSEKDININSQSNMLLYAKEGITLQAKNKILISTGESYIDITEDLIQMGAKQIMIN